MTHFQPLISGLCLSAVFVNNPNNLVDKDFLLVFPEFSEKFPFLSTFFCEKGGLKTLIKMAVDCTMVNLVKVTNYLQVLLGWLRQGGSAMDEEIFIHVAIFYLSKLGF